MAAGDKRKRFLRINHRHEQIINWMICNPDRPLSECAREFNYSLAWIYTLTHTDTFQAAYRKRCKEVGVHAVHTISNRLTGVTAKALDRLEEKIDAGEMTERGLIEFTKAALAGAGYLRPGARGSQAHLHLYVEPEAILAAREQAMKVVSGTTALKNESPALIEGSVVGSGKVA